MRHVCGFVPGVMKPESWHWACGMDWIVQCSRILQGKHQYVLLLSKFYVNKSPHDWGKVLNVILEENMHLLQQMLYVLCLILLFFAVKI